MVGRGEKFRPSVDPNMLIHRTPEASLNSKCSRMARLKMVVATLIEYSDLTHLQT